MGCVVRPDWFRYQRTDGSALRADDALETIGDSPLARLKGFKPGNGAEIWIKFEGENPTGSYKDRMAVPVVGRTVPRGELSPANRVVENTVVALAWPWPSCLRYWDIRFTAVFSDACSGSRRRSTEAFGAEVLVERSDDGTIPLR